jgi:hypothetical protein
MLKPLIIQVREFFSFYGKDFQSTLYIFIIDFISFVLFMAFLVFFAFWFPKTID